MIIRQNTRSRASIVSKAVFFSKKISVYLNADDYKADWRGKNIAEHIKRK